MKEPNSHWLRDKRQPIDALDLRKRPCRSVLWQILRRSFVFCFFFGTKDLEESAVLPPVSAVLISVSVYGWRCSVISG